MLSRVVFVLIACDLALPVLAAERPEAAPAKQRLLLYTERSELPAIERHHVSL